MPDEKRAPELDSATLMQEMARLWVTAQPAVSTYIRASVKDEHHADDLLQEVASVAASKFGEFDRDRPFATWAIGIARYKILDYYRSTKRDRLVFDESALVVLAEGFDRYEPHRQERREALEDCLHTLDGRRRVVLELRYKSELAATEIAERIGTTSNAVKILLHRTRQSLAECVNRSLGRGQRT